MTTDPITLDFGYTELLQQLQEHPTSFKKYYLGNISKPNTFGEVESNKVEIRTFAILKIRKFENLRIWKLGDAVKLTFDIFYIFQNQKFV